MKLYSLIIKKFFLNEFFTSGIVHWVFIGSLVVNLANWGLIIFFIRPVDFLLILHYNVYFGVDIIGPWWQLYFLPLIGIIILSINTILSYLFYQKKERIIAHLLMLAAFISQVGITIASVSILMMNY
ncbi:MAG TPA: hypothetical protein P5548_02140 [Candidatus Moranbacteria bacterium]|nr:hypothetical protein [Candidatus Moranbacteria bacterium]HRZ33673.1 hypothetical protein [Candidatus Moranbacteria bacterium]